MTSSMLVLLPHVNKCFYSYLLMKGVMMYSVNVKIELQKFSLVIFKHKNKYKEFPVRCRVVCSTLTTLYSLG